MKVESKEVTTATVKDVIAAVQPYLEQLRTDVGAKYPLTEIRVNVKEGRVFVVWEDYSEEEQRTNALIDEYLQLKSQLTDPVKQPSLMARMIEIANEFKQLTGLNIEEVVG